MVRYSDVTVHYYHWIGSDWRSIKNPALVSHFVPAAEFEQFLILLLAGLLESIIAVTIIQATIAARLTIS